MKAANPKIEESPELTVADILALPDALGRFLGWIIMSRAVTIESVAKTIVCTDDEAALLLEQLSILGLIERLPVCGEARYRVRLRGRRLRAPSELFEKYPGTAFERVLLSITDLHTTMHSFVEDRKASRASQRGQGLDRP
jgi:hypothetical protein